MLAYLRVSVSSASWSCMYFLSERQRDKYARRTTFLLLTRMFWPSFNGALATDEMQFRVVINTVLSLSACCVTAFLVDNLLRPEHKVRDVDRSVGQSLSELVTQFFTQLVEGGSRT